MHTFDIFDTLITRTTAAPDGIFMLMEETMRQRKKYTSYLRENFHQLRKGAEELARLQARQEGREEVTLDEIYRALATTASLGTEDAESLKKLEEETEYKNILPLPANIRLLKQYQSQGEHIALISDMYLPERVIRRLLSKADPALEGLPLYVSSTYAKTKASGALYEIVKEKERAAYEDWIHHGDNPCSDAEVPDRLGITSVSLPWEGLKEYECVGERFCDQLSTGAAIYARLQVPGGAAAETGSSLAGPILYPYVRWVLEESHRRSIHRLYFIARDGWILHRIAENIIKTLGLPIRTAYLYGSRKAWRLPCYDGSREELAKLLRWSNLDEALTLGELAAVFAMDVSALKRYLPPLLASIPDDVSLCAADKRNIIASLEENSEFCCNLVRNAEPQRDLLTRYLCQEMDLSDEHFAFVELSGTGYTQKCLARLMRTFYKGKIRNFYFKLDTVPDGDICSYLNFCPGNISRSYMLELLCRAPHGQTEGYMEKAGRVIPVLEETGGRTVTALEEYSLAVLAYTECLTRAFMQNGFQPAPSPSQPARYLCMIATAPPSRIARYFQEIPFSGGGRKHTCFAPAITRKQMRAICFREVRGESWRGIYQGHSLDYALLTTPGAVAYMEKCRLLSRRPFIRVLSFLLGSLTGAPRLFRCPPAYLQGSIVIYGAGKVGRAYRRQAGKKSSGCTKVLWVDTRLHGEKQDGVMIHSPQAIRTFPYDRIIIAVYAEKAAVEIRESLLAMGIRREDIFYG